MEGHGRLAPDIEIHPWRLDADPACRHAQHPHVYAFDDRSLVEDLSADDCLASGCDRKLAPVEPEPKTMLPIGRRFAQRHLGFPLLHRLDRDR